MLTLEAEKSTQYATIVKKYRELAAQSRVLEEKDAIISDMTEQLTKAREYLTSKRLVSHKSWCKVTAFGLHVSMFLNCPSLISETICEKS